MEYDSKSFEELRNLRSLRWQQIGLLLAEVQEKQAQVLAIDDEICDRIGKLIGMRFGDIIRISGVGRYFIVQWLEVTAHTYGKPDGICATLIPVRHSRSRWLQDHANMRYRMSIYADLAGINWVAYDPENTAPVLPENFGKVELVWSLEDLRKLEAEAEPESPAWEPLIALATKRGVPPADL